MEVDNRKEIIWHTIDELFAQDEIFGDVTIKMKPIARKYNKRKYFERVCKHFEIDREY